MQMRKKASSRDDTRGNHPAPKQASFLQVAWIVVSGMVMIGRGRDFGPDAPKIGPARLIIMAFVAALLVIGALVMLVRFITH